MKPRPVTRAGETLPRVRRGGAASWRGRTAAEAVTQQSRMTAGTGTLPRAGPSSFRASEQPERPARPPLGASPLPLLDASQALPGFAVPSLASGPHRALSAGPARTSPPRRAPPGGEGP